MTEPIDFSANDDEYLSSDLKQQVMAFSIIWAIVGFILSGWLFMGKKVGPASAILDRRQAEGRVVDSTSHGGSTASDYGGFSSRAPRVRSYLPPRHPEQEWSSLARLDSQSVPPPAPEPVRTPDKPVAEQIDATVETASTTPKGAAHATQPTRPQLPAAAAPENVDRLLYPIVSNRPERTNLSAVARKLDRSLIRLASLDGVYHVGLLLDRSGKALVSDSFLNDGSLDRVWVDGRLVRASLLGHDAEYGIAVIQLPDAGFAEPVPLAPDPPARGEQLIAFGPSPSRCISTVVRAGSGFGAAGFLVEGFLGSSTWGTPLLNDRGELVGCQFSSLPDFPGSGVHLAADSAAIFRLTRGYNSSNDAAYQSILQEAYGRLTSLAGETRDAEGVKRGRILAKVGVSQFFIGMSTEEANQWVSSPVRSSGADGVENWRSPAPPLELVFINNRLCAVATDFTGFSTETGLSMGARVDRQLLSRSFEQFLLVDGLALTPGLDILLDRDGKAKQFVVRPEL